MHRWLTSLLILIIKIILQQLCAQRLPLEKALKHLHLYHHLDDYVYSE